ncbi:MAG: nucleotidyltransferase family protein [Pseudomonadota bacterium]
MGIDNLIEEKRDGSVGIAEKHGARNERLSGSAVRGEAEDKSDVDFLVTLDENTTLLNHAALIEELEQLLGRKVDVAGDRGLRPRIGDRVLGEAIILGRSIKFARTTGGL